MKKVIFAVAALVLAVNVGMAQPAEGGRGQRANPEERQQRMEQAATRRSADLREKLALTPAQSAKVDSVNAKYDKQQIALFSPENRGGDRSAMRQKMENIQNARVAEVKTQLTEEQRTKYDQWMSDQQKERQNRQGGARGEGRPQGGM